MQYFQVCEPNVLLGEQSTTDGFLKDSFSRLRSWLLAAAAAAAAGELINERADVFTEDAMKRAMAQQITVCCVVTIGMMLYVVCNTTVTFSN